MADSVHIETLGDYDPNSPTLPSIERAISLAADELQLAAPREWLPTDSLVEGGLDKKLAAFDCLWAAPGSPYKSFDGKLGESFDAGTTGGFLEPAAACNTPLSSALEMCWGSKMPILPRTIEDQRRSLFPGQLRRS